MILVKNLTHTYSGTRKTRPRNALIDVDFHVETGRFCILSGPNGSGKSSLFRILAGLTLPSAGEVWIDGCNLILDPQTARQSMGVVFQNPAVDKYLSIEENLRLHALLYGVSGQLFEQRLAEALSWTNLSTRLSDKVESLSGGMARQVELVKALLTYPRLLLLDEPTTGLDAQARRSFMTLLRRLQQERGMTVLMTTHLFQEAEEADCVAIMKDGRILVYDTPQALRARLSREMVVVMAKNPDSLHPRLVDEMSLDVSRYGEELRIRSASNDESIGILSVILDRYRSDLSSIAIKQADLEDVFIDIAGGLGHADLLSGEGITGKMNV